MAERNDVGPNGDQCQDSCVDRESMKYIKIEKDDPSRAVQEHDLLIPASSSIECPVCDRRDVD